MTLETDAHDLAARLTEELNALGLSAVERTVAGEDAARRAFPSVANLRWEIAFAHNPELLGALLRDILKLSRAVPGRHGPRPGLDRVRDMPALDRLRGLDPTRHPYSLLPFPEAFSLLLGERSVRGAANRLGMTPTRVYRLQHGLGISPQAEEMEHIAERFGHHPSFFREYREWAIAQAIAERLAADPETSIRVYERLWHATGAAEAAGAG